MNKGLLEKYAGAAAAYSVRLLNRNYTGPLLKVRRVDAVTSQDNGEIFVFADNTGWISLDSKVIDPSNTSVASTLGGFVNASGYTDGDKTTIGTNTQHAYVSVWKDQSGNANDASQSVAGNQPQIVDAATGVITENGKPIMIDSEKEMFTATFTGGSSATISAVCVGTNGYKDRLLLGNTGHYFGTQSDSSGSYVSGIGTVTTYANNVLQGNLTQAQADALILNTQTHLFATCDLSAWTSELHFGYANRGGMNMQEIIIWNSNQTSPTDNRTGIEENINEAFSIYSVALEPTEGSFLGKYTDAAAAYSTRNLTGRDKQPILKVRRELGTDTDTEQTIYSGSDGFLDKNQLLNFVNEVSEDPRLPLDISEGYGYSLRVVKAGYTGPLIQVRESGGNTTKDIYAGSDGNINISALETFCGSNDGHVSKWYNQSGVERTLEADAAANQPKIVESGVVVRNTLNSIALKFTNAGNEFLGIQDATAFDLQEQCIAMNFMSTALPTSGTDRILGLVNPTGTSLDLTIRNTVAISSLGHLILSTEASNETLASIAQTVNTPSILTFNFNGGSSSGTSNKTTQAGTLIANDIKGLAVGARFSVTSTADFLTSEVIQYTSAQTGDNKIEIEASLNKYYKVYGDAYVSTWYDQSLAADESYLLDSAPGAAAAYSLRKLREDYDGAAIEVRRDSDEASKTIGFTASGELDTDELINFCSGANGYVANWYNQAFNSKNELLLDATEGQNAEAAYSVRQLSSTATECMVIRRASDSKLRTIGFKNKEIDEAAIESFCTGTTCTVYQWLDQSGNGNTATAASTGVEPTIYTGGACVKENGKLALDFGGTSQLDFTTIAKVDVDPFAVFTVAQDTPNNLLFVDSTDNQNDALLVFTSYGQMRSRWNGSNYIDSINSDSLYRLFSVIDDGTNPVNYYYSGQLVTDAAYPVTNKAINLNRIGGIGYQASQQYAGIMQEAIFYASNKSSVRTDIEENINNYYGIYSTNNAEQGVSLNQPKIYDSTNGIIEENGKPAVEFDGTDDNLLFTTVSDTPDLFMVCQTTDTDAILFGRSGSNNPWHFIFQDGSTNTTITAAKTNSGNFGYLNGTLFANNGTTTRDQLHASFADGNQNLTYWYGLDLLVAGNWVLGKANFGFPYAGKYQEFIMYTSDQSNNRLEIEGNINSHYRVYGSNDASQGTASAQPALVNNGRVILENGKAAVEFNGSSEFMNVNFQGNTNSAMLASLVIRQNSTSGNNVSLGGSALNLWTDYSNTIYFDNGNQSSNRLSVSSPSGWDNNQHLVTAYSTGSNQYIIVDGSQLATKSITTSTNASFLYIGKTNVTNAFFGGAIQEIVVYAADESSNRSSIESNINRAFGIYWDGTQRSLLDDQPNAAAAYSVRALSSSYTGPLVEIRDANGNTQDIYATYNGDLDENAINDFCTGSTCTISTWYDQSGNSNNAAQGTALNQPTIYTGGQLVKEGGRLALDFDGSNDSLTSSTPPFTGTTNRTSFTVSKGVTATSSQIIYGITDNAGQTGGYWQLTSETQLRVSGRIAFNNSAQTIHSLGTLIFDGTTVDDANFYLNGTITTQGTSTGATINTGSHSWGIGRNGTTGTDYYEGKQQELIFYASAKSSTDRTSIEENINRYYNIYSRLPGDRLLNKFPGAAAAYSVRAINSLYLGPLIRVRRDSDNVHADVYVDVNLTISDTSKVGILSSSTDPIEPKSNTSLKTFMDGNNGFVAVWYDQASSNDASQSNAINQPKIYDSADGVIVENGKPALDFTNAVNLFLKNSSGQNLSISATDYSFIYVQKRASATGWIFDSQTGRFVISLAGNLFYDGSWKGSAPTSTAHEINYFDFVSPSSTNYYVNGSLNQGPLTYTQKAIGGLTAIGSGYSGSSPMNGTLQEFIIYTTPQTSYRTNIESDINTFYNIYAKPKRLLDEFGGAAAAYSLRRLNSLYTGPLVKIRRDSDNVEVNVYPDLEGNFSLNSQVTNVAETTTGSSQVAFSYSTPYATLSQFVESSPNCFVVEWKDQSSNNNHATQNAAAIQPKIYDGTTGTVVDNNGKPTLSFINDKVTLTNELFLRSNAPDAFLISLVAEGTEGTSDGEYFGGSTFGSTNFFANYGSTSNYRFRHTNDANTGNINTTFAYPSPAPVVGEMSLLNLYIESSTKKMQLNGQQLTASGNTVWSSTSNYKFNLGVIGRPYAEELNLQVSEFVVWPNQSSTDLSEIQSNINTFYDIY